MKPKKFAQFFYSSFIQTNRRPTKLWSKTFLLSGRGPKKSFFLSRVTHTFNATFKLISSKEIGS